MKSISRYAKLVVAVVGAVATWATATFPNDTNVQKWVGLALAIATAVGVYATPNQPPAGVPADPTMSEQGQAGYANGLAILAVLVLLIALIGGFTATHVLFWLVILAIVLFIISAL